MRGGKVQSNSVDILGVAVSRVNSVQVNVLIGSNGQGVTINLYPLNKAVHTLERFNMLFFFLLTQTDYLLFLRSF